MRNIQINQRVHVYPIDENGVVTKITIDQFNAEIYEVTRDSDGKIQLCRIVELDQDYEQIVRNSGKIVITKERETGWISFYRTDDPAQEEKSFQADYDGWRELSQDLDWHDTF